MLLKLFRKGEQKPKVKAINFKDVGKEVEKRKTEQLEKFKNFAKEPLRKLQHQRAEILKVLKQLKESEVSEEIHPGLYRASIEARRLLVEKTTRVLEEVKIGELKALDDITTLKERLERISTQTAHAILAHGKRPSIVFGREMRALKTAIIEFQQTVNEITKKIEEMSPVIEQLNLLKAKTESYQQLKIEMIEREKQLATLRNRKKELEAEAEKKQKEAEIFARSPHYREAEELAKKIREVEAEIARIQHEFETRVHTVNRLLRKIRKVVEKELSRERRLLISVLIHEPASVLDTEEKARAAQSLLEVVLTVAESEQIEKDKKKQEKMMAELRRLISEKTIESTFNRIRSLQSEKEKLLARWEKEPELEYARIKSAARELEEQTKQIEKEIQLMESMSHGGKVNQLQEEIKQIGKELGMEITFS